MGQGKTGLGARNSAFTLSGIMVKIIRNGSAATLWVYGIHVYRDGCRICI